MSYRTSIVFTAVLTAAACPGRPVWAQSAPATQPEARIPVSGARNPDLAPLDDLMISVVQKHNVPGAALAVTRDGRLVYARGFGYADLSTRRPVQPNSLFRIASVSKPITATAVLQLVEKNKLRLDDRVFDILKLQPHLAAGAKVDERLGQITVLQLLHHTGGWDIGKSGDPMFMSVQIARELHVAPPAGTEQIIRYMMGRPLDFDPGTRYSYSNFGYCLLGRIIETAGGQPYERYVREHVLATAGIRDMRIGKTLPAFALSGEVRYYDSRKHTGPCVFKKDLGRTVPAPYGASYLEAMDSHGGWVASAVDLVRFAGEFDRPERCRLLGAKGIRTMFARPAGPARYDAGGKPRSLYYACGWNVRPVGSEGKVTAWHNGALGGTSSLLLRRHDGMDWAVLFNTDSGSDGILLCYTIDTLLHQAVDTVKVWPKEDLFKEANP